MFRRRERRLERERAEMAERMRDAGLGMDASGPLSPSALQEPQPELEAETASVPVSGSGSASEPKVNVMV
eukprot:COSAG02_NODE_42980_length_379_cov_0.857143_1_plen_69_part_01